MSKKKLTTFGETIKQLRMKRKLPQRKVAAQLDIDTSLLAKYEKNVRQPSKELIIKIAQIFNVDSDALIFEATSDRLAHQFAEEGIDQKLLRMAENKVPFFKSKLV